MVDPFRSENARKFRSCYKLPPDPKCAIQEVPKFIPLNVVSRKGGSSIGQTPLQSIDELLDVPPCSWLLISGGPGSGKSTLAYEILKQWKDGASLHTYALVLLLHLQKENVNQYWSSSAEGLIGAHLNEHSCEPQEIKNVIEGNGQGLLLILESYNELPVEKLHCHKIFFRKLKKSFQKATVIITTRPSAVDQLQNAIHFTKEIKIIGFSKPNQNCFVKTFFENDETSQKLFKKYAEERPLISECLHVPLNLITALKIFCSDVIKSGMAQLPETSTEMYMLFVRMLVYKNLPASAEFPSLNKLHWRFNDMFQRRCKLAYDGLFSENKHPQVVFEVSKEIETFGLMKNEHGVQVSHDKAAFSFINLIIQEFLAAYHIHNKLPSEQHQKHLDEHSQNQTMSNTMLFLAGLTKLHMTIPAEQKTDQPAEPTTQCVFQLNVFHQLMETKNYSLISEALNQNKIITVKRISTIITEQDFYVLGRCFGLSSCAWRLGFTLRGLKNNHIEKFVSGFNDAATTAPSPNPPSLDSPSPPSPSLEHVTFSLNPIGNEGLATFLSLPSSILKTITNLFLRATSLDKDCCITELEHLVSLETFLFHDNNFNEGEQQQVIDVLCKLKHLKKVSFSSLSPEECTSILTQLQKLMEVELYELTGPSIEVTLTSLSLCSSLQCIEVHQSQITREVIEKSLCQSLPRSTLQKLKLINCGIDSKTAISIIDAVMLSPNLQTLDLSDNVIDDEGGCYIASKLDEKSLSNPVGNITHLLLNHNNFTNESVDQFISKLAQVQLPNEFMIHLSMQWKDFINEHCPHTRHFDFQVLPQNDSDDSPMHVHEQPQDIQKTAQYASLEPVDVAIKKQEDPAFEHADLSTVKAGNRSD